MVVVGEGGGKGVMGREYPRRRGGCGGVSGWAWRTSRLAFFVLSVLNYQLSKFARMPSILVIVFILQLAIHLVNTVGAQAINDLVIPPPPKLPSHSASSTYTNKDFLITSYGRSTARSLPPTPQPCARRTSAAGKSSA